MGRRTNVRHERIAGKNYLITFSYAGERRRERVYCEHSAANDRTVEAFAEKIKARLLAGTFDYAEFFPQATYVRKQREANPGAFVKTVTHCIDAYLVSLQTKRQSSTLDNNRKMALVLTRDFGDLTPYQVTEDAIDQWVEKQTVSTQTIRCRLSFFRQVLEYARKKIDRDLPRNIIPRGYKIERIEEPERERIDPFTADEQEAILRVLTGQEYALVLFALWSGLRPSELISLHWSDVDWIGRKVHIWRKRTAASKGRFEAPKTKGSRRFVDLLAPALAALEAQKAFTFARGTDSPIFLNPRTNRAWRDDDAIRKQFWARALKRAGVRYRSPYAMRHTFASMQVSVGAEIRWIAEQLGHTNFVQLQKTYAKWLPPRTDIGQAAVQAFYRPKSSG